MARGGRKSRGSPAGMARYWDELMAVPRSFFLGWLAGLLVPVAGLAGIVAGIYLFTRKVPIVSQIDEEEGERHLVVKLAEVEEARGLLQKSRDAAQAFGDEIRSEFEGSL
jgi:hypothetical protein